MRPPNVSVWALTENRGHAGQDQLGTASYSITNEGRAGTGKDAVVQVVLDVGYMENAHSSRKAWTTLPEDTRE